MGIGLLQYNLSAGGIVWKALELVRRWVKKGAMGYEGSTVEIAGWG